MAKCLIICGVIWISMSFITKTKNLPSSILFKVIPFFTGIATVMCAMQLYGWINIFN